MRSLVLLLIAAPLAAQVDTTATKASLLAADNALNVRIQDGSEVPLLQIADSNAAILIPGQPIMKAVDAQKVWHDRYFAKGNQYEWRAVHAIASADGQFGC